MSKHISNLSNPLLGTDAQQKSTRRYPKNKYSEAHNSIAFYNSKNGKENTHTHTHNKPETKKQMFSSK